MRRCAVWAAAIASIAHASAAALLIMYSMVRAFRIRLPGVGRAEAEQSTLTPIRVRGPASASHLLRVARAERQPLQSRALGMRTRIPHPPAQPKPIATRR